MHQFSWFLWIFESFVEWHGHYILGQPAVTLLTSVVEHAESPWRRPALALIGSGKFRDGQTEQACHFRTQALEGVADFPDRAQAVADFGLVLLPLGNSAGLDRLHEAQKMLEESSQIDQLIISLENEAAYQTRLGSEASASQIHARIDAIQRR